MNDQRVEEQVSAGDDAAIARAVAEHLGWVYGAALRQVGDHHLAEDVTQAVFLLLARKAGSMPRETRLAGWLFRAVRYCSNNALKLQRRRQFHEKRSAGSEVAEVGGDWWEKVRPVVDEAVSRLSRADRDLVLARYYQNQPYEQIGKAFGLSAEAAKKRVQRAVGQLREMLRARSADLPEQAEHLLAQSMASVAPAGLATAVLAATKGSASAGAASLAAKLSKSLWLAKVKLAGAVVGAAVVVGGATVVATRPTPVAVAATTAPVVAAAAPEPAAPVPLPTVALSPSRENAVYVNYHVLMDEVAMTDLRKIGTPLGAVAGVEQWSCDNEALRQLLRDNLDSGVIGDGDSAGVGAHTDKPRQHNRRIVADRTWGGTKIPGERWAYRNDGYSLYSARTAGGQAMISLVQMGQPMLVRNGAPTPAALSTKNVSAFESVTIPVGRSLVHVKPLGNTDLTPWHLLTIVQVYPADSADASFLASAASVALNSWLTGSARQWMIDARRSALWYAKLPATDRTKWVWTLPGEKGTLKLEEVSDTSASTSMVWSPEGGRCVSSRPEGPYARGSAGPKLRVGLPDYRVETVDLPASGPVTLGVGHGKFTRIGVVPAKDGARVQIGTKAFRYERETVYYDNEPATDIAFVALDREGKEAAPPRSGVWTGEKSKPAKELPSGPLYVNGQTVSIGIYTRERLWRTFEGVARRPVVAAPTDAEVVASFSRPLDVPVAPADSDDPVDPFAATGAKTLFVQADAAGQRMRWFGERTGREYYEGQGFRSVTDGTRCYRWADGAEWPTISSWSQGNENSMDGASMYEAMAKFPASMANAKEVGREMIDKVQTTVFEGTLPQLNNAKVKVWKDDRARIVQIDLMSAMTVSMRYDLPADEKWFEVPEALKSRPADDQKGQEIAKKLTERPAIIEKQDGPRTFRLHEVLTGENGMRFVCYSTQLTPKAAELMRFVPYGRDWGRGIVSDMGYPELTPYRIVPMARIDAPDRSIRWYVLLPKETVGKEPWRVSIDMLPMAQNNIGLLESAGFTSFGAVEFELSDGSNAQPMALDDYVKRVYAEVHSYTAAMPPLTDEFAKPATGTMPWFVNEVKKDVEKARAGGYVPTRAN